MKNFNQIFKVGIVALSSLLFAGNTNAQLEQGDIIIDASYSLAGPKGLTWRAIEVNDNSSLSQMGPVGIKFQYMAKESFGVGLDVSFTNRKGSWDGYNYDSLSNSVTVPRAAEQTIIRAMLRTSWEIINNESFQLFWANSVGYRSVNWTGYIEGYELVSSPLAMRTAMGMRFFLSESVGISLELGLGGGSAVCLGAAIKL